MWRLSDVITAESSFVELTRTDSPDRNNEQQLELHSFSLKTIILGFPFKSSNFKCLIHLFKSLGHCLLIMKYSRVH